MGAATAGCTGVCAIGVDGGMESCALFAGVSGTFAMSVSRKLVAAADFC